MLPNYLFSKLSIKWSEIQNFRCLFEATSYYHNVFTFTLFLSEGQAGVAWVASNKIMLCSPSENKVILTSPLDFLFASTLHLSVLYLSLTFRVKGVIMHLSRPFETSVIVNCALLQRSSQLSDNRVYFNLTTQCPQSVFLKLRPRPLKKSGYISI
jgi:hypothetical protein